MTIYCDFTKIYPSTAVVLFCISSWVISQQFNGLRTKVKSLMINYNPLDSDNEGKKALLAKLQRHQVQIYRSVELLNRCFGLILLIDIPFHFIGVINTTMILVMTNGAGALLPFKMLKLVTLFIHTFNVILVSLCSDKIASNVIIINNL